MATITKAVTAPRPTLETTQPKAPVKGWFWAGIAFLVVQGIAFAGWFISGDFVATDPGPTPLPGYMRVFITVLQAIGLPASILTIWLTVVRPWRRTGGLTAAGMFTIAMCTVWWQDTLLNFIVTICTYNGYLFNRGAWNPHVLGWVSPLGNRIAEPLLITLTVYVWLVVPWVLIGVWVMRKAKARWPKISNVKLVLVAFAWTAVADCIIEPLFMRGGEWTYPGAIQALSINAGKYYQFPLYEPVLWGGLCAAWSALVYFLDDRGRTFAEKGAENLKSSGRKNTLYRVIAVSGAANVLFMAFYTLPMQFFALHADEWPEDIVKRSYFTNGFCGPGTTYACSDPQNPIPRTGSARIGPDGNAVPAGTPRCVSALPASSPARTSESLAIAVPDCPAVK